MTEDWIVGFVWGIGSNIGNRLSIRFQDENLLEQICITLNISNRPFHPTEGRTAIQLSMNKSFPQRLLALGWSGRSDENRQYPKGEIDDLEFIRGYCYTKATYEHSKPRLRIYGSSSLLQQIDQYFIDSLATTPKKLQICRGKTQDGYEGLCYALYYQSQKEVPRMAEILQL